MIRPKGGNLAVQQDGQMMMLGAIVLVLGFLALAGMVARVGQLGPQVGKEQQRPMLLEIGPMADGLADAVAALSERGYTPGTAAYSEAVRGIMEHMRALEASRGLLLEYTMNCAGNPATGYTTVSLSDGELTVTIRVTC